MDETTQVYELGRLTPEQYDALVKRLGAMPFVGVNTTELQAGQMIGMQYVLQVLREGWVIN